MAKRIFFFLYLFLIWLGLTWSLDTQEVIAGLIIVTIASFLFSGMMPEELVKIINPLRLFWLILYIPVFTFYVIKANFDVAYRVFHPDLPIKPGIVKVKTKLKTNLARTFLANSITLTPGTLTIDMVDDILYIHWINITSVDQMEETKIIVEKFERFLWRIFE
ncbi:Na+/H+ antiporter subunit E [candidate division KSB1 bacterium]